MKVDCSVLKGDWSILNRGLQCIKQEIVVCIERRFQYVLKGRYSVKQPRSVHCALYIVQCTVYIVLMHSVNVCNIRYTVYSVHCTLYSVYCTMYSDSVHRVYTSYTAICLVCHLLFFTCVSVQCALYSVHCTLFTVPVSNLPYQIHPESNPPPI